MQNDLRAILELRGLSKTASDREAQEFYAALPLEDKGKIGVALGLRGYGDASRPANVLTTRATAEDTSREITTRAFCVRAESVDDDNRSVEAVIATDQPVTVYDWRTGEMVDEVLRMDGVQVSDQIPMLANHSRWSLNDIYGSARGITTGEHEVKGRLYFAEGDEDAERAWQKVRGGHIRDVSAGYRAEKYTDVRPGQSAVVGGQTYRAKGRTLRVTTRWALKEVSLVPIGADSHSKIRADQPQKEVIMPKKLRTYLESIGLRAEATTEEASTFLAALEGEQQQRAATIEAEGDGKQRSDPPADLPADPPTEPTAGDQRSEPVDPQAIAREAIADERQRVRSLTDLAGDDVPAEILQRAIGDGSTVEAAGGVFLASVRKRGPTGPAIHSSNHDADCNVRSLAAGLLVGQGLDPTKHSLHRGDRTPTRKDKLTEQDADGGDQFRGMSAVDVCRECVRMDGGHLSHNREDTIRAAMSGTSLSSVFTTNVYARLMAGWATVGDTTVGWCDEEDVPNFLEQEDVSLDADAQLERLPSGDTAKHATASDSSETYKIARYAKQFVVDEQTVINDRFGAIMRMPAEMGENARKLRPNLVYSLLLENPTMTDTGAVFNATAVTTAGGHANLTTAVLGAEGLRAAITAMVTQRLGRTLGEPGDALNIRPNFLIVPPDLEWTARALLSSGNLVKLFADSADPLFAPINLIAQEGITLVIDGRLDAVGVRDPKSKTVRTGSATNWFLTEGGSRGLRVAYRSGTSRSPSLRSFALSQGQWGQGWDINLDIGASFTEYRTWHKSTGSP